MSLPACKIDYKDALLEGISEGQVEQASLAIAEILDRAAAVHYDTHPWATGAGMELEEFLLTPNESHRSALHCLLESVRELEKAAHASIPPFSSKESYQAIGASRARLADEMDEISRAVPLPIRDRWAKAEPKAINQARKSLAQLAPLARAIREQQLDPELSAIASSSEPSLSTITSQATALESYLSSAKKWYGFLAFARKKAATAVLASFGLSLSAENAARVLEFLAGSKSRVLAKGLLKNIATGDKSAPNDEAELEAAATAHEAMSSFLGKLADDRAIADLAEPAKAALQAPTPPSSLLDGLRRSAAYAERMAACEKAFGHRLFSDSLRQSLVGQLRSCKLTAQSLGELERSFGTLEDVLRVRQGLRALADQLRDAVIPLVMQRVSGKDGLLVLGKAALTQEITRRMRDCKPLIVQDGEKLKKTFARYTDLDRQKKEHTSAAVLHLWGERQKERLLARTLSRLSSAGADVRRRFTLRGERALRLRQVISLGAEIEGGDPLFDLRPVWMASPETVAQIFPRTPLFDVVIFDEASQCRLEEALPVLLRAKRVVVAGDPKQLPPTRFFEVAQVASEDEEIETEQDLFDRQQGEMEDLLSAALNIPIDEAYLDVHYRSRNSDLIAFSNENFYGSRLQPIPGHPSNRVRYAPLTLYQVNGVYEERMNTVEAEKVCSIVADLLKRAEPPSIGIACFNVAQRDLILDRLEEQAGRDAGFARALAEARERRGKGAFEGLFVKNLENVQGDERDHLIISTTYGPDAKGKFYRRFGPVGQAGGARRLNVLVTRARDEIHVVTSIPQAVYRNLPPVPAGAAPSGAWLLFAYLRFAESLATVYEESHQRYVQAEERKEPLVQVNQSRFPSPLAQQLAGRLRKQHGIGSDVHWGNDGFCVDLALHHPAHPEDVTIGVQCDMNRFAQAADPVEWEIFRNMILESQGWKICRVWSPQLFRDRKPVFQAILNDVKEHLENEPARDGIPVVGSRPSPG